MYKNFEFDKDRSVAAALVYNPGLYIQDRIQELNGTRYGLIIDETAKLAINHDSSPQSRFERIAFKAGATVAFEAFDYSKLPEFKKDYAKHVFLCSGLPPELKKQKPETIREQIQASATIGAASHPELKKITDLVSAYYIETSQQLSMQIPVRLGIGRTAFVLDKCVGALRYIDPNFDIAQTLEETDWSNIEPEDIIKDTY